MTCYSSIEDVGVVIVELKPGRFTHADIGRMNLLLYYARKHWPIEQANPPIDILLSTTRLWPTMP